MAMNITLFQSHSNGHWSHVMRDWRASEYSGESWLFQVDSVAVFADLFMPSFQEYGVALTRVILRW